MINRVAAHFTLPGFPMCLSRTRLAIEVYGGVHVLQQVRDACRKQALQTHGLRVLVLRDDASMNEMRRAILASLWEP